MNIRKVKLKDFKKLYQLGLKTPELKVSSTEYFMDPEEFKFNIKNIYEVFLLSEENDNIIGFIYANAKDEERDYTMKWACLVYLAVKKKYRVKGIATKLYNECCKELNRRKIKFIYGCGQIQNLELLNS